MHRQWRLRRQTQPAPDGRRRWNRVYQLLVEWAAPHERGRDATTVLASGSTPAYQEGTHAPRDVPARLDPATSPTADQ